MMDAMDPAYRQPGPSQIQRAETFEMSVRSEKTELSAMNVVELDELEEVRVAKNCTGSIPCETATLLKGKVQRMGIRNSLLVGVGYLEFGNACDFPANIFNHYPLPKYAIALMTLGGCISLFTSHYAVRDAFLSLHNIKILKEERRWLLSKRQRAESSGKAGQLLNLKCSLDVNFREIGVELFDRLCMDILLGFGAVLVSVGTFMAIGGSNDKVYRASNLLSGYIGNTPGAIFGIINLVWSIYLWRRSGKHVRASDMQLAGNDATLRLLKNRASIARHHALLGAVTGIIASAGSLISATLWWGYVILIPCIISFLYFNYIFRRHIGYDRPSIIHTALIDKEAVLEQLQQIHSLRQVLIHSTQPVPLSQVLVTGCDSINKVISFMTQHGLFEDYITFIIADSRLSRLSKDAKQLQVDDLLACSEEEDVYLMQAAQNCINMVASKRLLNRQRYLLELLGSFMYTTVAADPRLHI